MIARKRVLFIVPSFFTNRPQAIRFRNIIHYLKQTNEIHVLYPSDTRTITTKQYDKYFVHEYPCSGIGRFINPVYYPHSRGKRIDRSFTRMLLRFFFRNIAFPDLFLFEINRLKRAIIHLSKERNFEIIVGSAVPFTIALLGKFLKKEFPKTKWILDIGDPYYKNSALKYPIQRIFAKRFEEGYLKYLDHFVVTNNATRQHYLNTFSSRINGREISVIPQGASIANNNSGDILLNVVDNLNLIYAGIFYSKIRQPFELYHAISSFNKNSDSKIFLHVYGTVTGKFRRLPSVEDAQYIKFYGPINSEEVYQKFVESDIVIHIDNSFGLQTPGKNYEVIACKKPLLFIFKDESSPSYELFHDYSPAFKARNERNAIRTVFEEIFQKRNYLFEMNFDINKYSWQNCANSFQIIFES